MVKMAEVPKDIFTPKDTKKFNDITKNTLTLFIYNKNLLFKSERKVIDESNLKVRTELRKDIAVAPVEVLALFDGVEIKENIIKRNEYTVDLNKCNFTIAPFMHFGKLYVPIIETAKALGLDGDVFYKNRLIIIGEKEDIKNAGEIINKNPNIAVAGADELIGKYDAYKFTHEDFIVAKNKWREYLVGTPETINLNDEGMQKKLKAIENNAKKLLAEMNREPDAVILWGENPPSISGHVIEQYSKINALAHAWGTYGTELYHDENLKKDIIYAFKWMYENMYGEAEIEDRGWRSVNDFNWWDWYVGGPENLTDAMLITEELFTEEEKRRYLKLFKYLLDTWRLSYTQNECSGRMAVETKCALLLEDPERLTIASNDFHNLLEVVLEGPGTHTDYGNYQHGSPYNLMYGVAAFNRIIRVGSCLSGTPLEFTSHRMYNQYKQFEYMFDAAMFKGRGFICYKGRASCESEMTIGYELVNLFAKMIGNFGPEEDDAIRKFIKYSVSTDEQKNTIINSCSLSSYSVINSVLNDITIPAEDLKEYAHAWFSADRATQHRKGYAFMLSMPSYRHPNYECINYNNKTGWYMNEGALYLYTKTDMHEFDGVNFILNDRVSSNIPGTTTDVRKRPEVSISEGYVPNNDIVGCMDFEKLYISAGMDYTAYNMEKAEEKPDTGYGGGNPKFINDLVAKKAYFMFDKECVCLGAGINSTMNSDIVTTLEHRSIVKLYETEKENKITVNGDELTGDKYELKFKNPTYACNEGFSGFVFLDVPEITVSKYYYAYNRKRAKEISGDYVNVIQYEPTKGSNYIEILLNHGKNPVNASYAYAVLPYASDETLKSYSENPEIEIIANTNSCQAVKKPSLNITSIFFYEAGECAGIKVNKPCLVTFKETNGEFKIKIAEPTNKVDTLEIEIDKKLSLIKADGRFENRCGDICKLTLNTSRSQGEGYEALFKIEEN